MLLRVFFGVLLKKGENILPPPTLQVVSYLGRRYLGNVLAQGEVILISDCHYSSIKLEIERFFGDRNQLINEDSFVVFLESLIDGN